MSLSQTQIQLVQDSFQQVVPIAETAASLFYQRLFETMPEASSMFTNTDMKEQGKKLMQMLTVAVAGLTRLENIVPAIKALGARHVRYGVQDSHYQTVGEALLWTLEQGLGAAFTPDVKEAWALVYAIVAETAISGAHEALAAQPTE
jgi:hemoglobin-like flavoprotein